MANTQQIEERIDKRELATLPFEEALEAYTPNFVAALPPEISVEHFKRMVITAINTTPELRSADRRTLFNACVKCASDGLLPDGREAALTVFRTKTKDANGGERFIDAVQYLPMVAGIRKRLRNSGEVASAIAEVVYKNDKFRYLKGVGATIEHEPAALDQEPGEAIGAYAIITLTNGERIFETLRKVEIEAIRKTSRAPGSVMWRDFWGEGARKSALRRAAKAAPQAASLNRLLDRDDELPELPPVEEMRLIPPRPQREDYQEQPASEPWFIVYNEVGEEEEFEHAADAVERVIAAMGAAARSRGKAGVEAVRENNDLFFDTLADGRLQMNLANHYDAIRKEFDSPPQPVPPAAAEARDGRETLAPAASAAPVEPASGRDAPEADREAPNLAVRTPPAAVTQNPKRAAVADLEKSDAIGPSGETNARPIRQGGVTKPGNAGEAGGSPATDIVAELGRKLTDAAQKGRRELDKAWLALEPLERDLARPMRAQYQEIADQAEVKDHA